MLFVLSADPSLAIKVGNDRYGRQTIEVPLTALSDDAREWLAERHANYLTEEYPGARRKGGEFPKAVDLDSAMQSFHDYLPGAMAIPLFDRVSAETVEAAIQYTIEVLDGFWAEKEAAMDSVSKAIEKAIKSKSPMDFIRFIATGDCTSLSRNTSCRKASDAIIKMSEDLPESEADALKPKLLEVYDEFQDSFHRILEDAGVEMILGDRERRSGKERISRNSEWASRAIEHHHFIENFELKWNIGFDLETSDGEEQFPAPLKLFCKIFRSISTSEGTRFWRAGSHTGRREPNSAFELYLDKKSEVELVKEAFLKAKVDPVALLEKVNRLLAQIARPMDDIADAAILKLSGLIEGAAAKVAAQEKAKKLARQQIENHEMEILIAADAARPDLSILERHRAGVLPKEERETYFREHTMSPIASHAKFQRIEAREFKHSSYYNMQCGSELKKELTAEEFNGAKRVRALMPEATVEVMVHTCQMGSEQISRPCLRVQVPFHGRVFSRELALPLS